jgi:uncharacterized membrane protein
MRGKVRQMVAGALMATSGLLIAAGVPTGASERAYSYLPVDYPDAVATTLSGINAQGDIVGSYRDSESTTHGFVLRDGVFTTIDIAGAAGTDARGINPAGDIVGGYWLPGEPAANIHGYVLRRDATLEYIDYPEQINTIPQRLLPDGTILGCYHGTDTMMSMFGMWMRDGITDATAQSASMHNGATPDLSVIAGLFTDLSEPAPRAAWGYVIENGVFTRFRVPGSNMTAVWDVGPSGALVGVYRNAAGIHGFLLEDGQYTSIDYPAATTTRAFGINAGGDIVGHYVKDGVMRAFLARRTGRSLR